MGEPANKIDIRRSLISRLYIKTYKLFSNINLPDYTLFSIYSVLIGIAVGLSSVLFHHSIEFFNQLFFQQTAEGLFFLGGFAVIALPMLGMLIQSIMIMLSPETSRKRGVAEIIKAVSMRGTKIPFRTTLFHFLAPVISIGSGNTVGPEGPAAQLGGGVANKISQSLNFSDNRTRIFTAAGSGAAIAAIFNTPLGGIFFAIEIVLLNDFKTSVFSALILSSVTASAISRIFLGNSSVFIFSAPDVGQYHHFYIYALLGISAGFLSILFIKYSNFLDDIFHKKILKHLPQWSVMTFIGLIVGVCGYFYEDIFGIGYSGINNVLSIKFNWNVVLILLILKFLLVPLILNSGGFGGVFAPSLFMGACFGFLFAFSLNFFFGLNLDITAFVLVGMGAFLGGINSIPISSILIIFEMTKDYTFILPLMLAIVSSTMVVQISLKKSIHQRHLEKQGYKFNSNSDVSLLRSILVSQIMKRDVVLLPEDTPLPKVLNLLMESNHRTFYTINSSDKLTGTISENDFRYIITEYDSLREVLVARDIASSKVTTVADSDNLDHVMKLFEKTDADEFPVKSSINPDLVIGSIRRKDVIAAYNKESIKGNSAEEFSHELEKISTEKQFKLFDEFLIAERSVPPKFVGKSLSELNLRNVYRVQVLMIREHASPYSEDNVGESLMFPQPDYTLKGDDTLIIFGTEEMVLNTQKWYK
ncbi:MAG: chloride channel protein [Melioribacteraceae bacterium]|jgi:CIC family chloride channel protein|nr:chloride channel protein [Melioribacteraceae bacterium]